MKQIAATKAADLAELKRLVAEGIKDSEAGRIQLLTKTLMEDIKTRCRIILNYEH